MKAKKLADEQLEKELEGSAGVKKDAKTEAKASEAKKTEAPPPKKKVKKEMSAKQIAAKE